MSEKHLTELPWKQLATKQKIKDPGLGKALAAYGKASEQDYDARLAALDEIKSQAGGLQKEHKKDKDVADYLAEVVKEVDKTRKAIGDLQKSGGGGEDDGETEEYKKDLKKKLVSAMAQVKGRAPGATEPGEEGQPQLQFMAYVASGASAVIVAKKVGGATKKLLPAIAGGASGGKYISGECIFEKNVHTFVVEKVPGGLAKKLSKALLAETGIKYKVRVRSLDGAQELDSDTDTEAGEIPAAPAPPSGGIDPKQLLAAMNKLTPLIKKAVEANPARKNEILKPVVEFQSLLKANQLDQAKAKILEVGALLKTLGTQSAAAGPAKPAESKQGFSIVGLQKSRLAWDSLRNDVQAQLRSLDQAIMSAVRAHNEDESAEDEYSEGEVGTAVKTLYTILDKLDTRLIDKLDEALNAQIDDERRARHQEAAGIIKQYRAFAASDPTLAMIDENGFTQTSIRSAVASTLTELAGRF